VLLRQDRETHTFFGTRSVCRKLIRYRGVAPGETTDEKKSRRSGAQIERFLGIRTWRFGASVDVTDSFRGAQF